MSIRYQRLTSGCKTKSRNGRKCVRDVGTEAELADRRAYVVGTADTKGDELAFLAATIRAEGVDVATVDIGTRSTSEAFTFTAETVAACHPRGGAALHDAPDRGTAVTAMAEAFAAFIAQRSDIAAVVGIGGGGGTSIVTTGMRALPIGVPKVMVSTLASGDVSSYVDVSDIVMFPSIADIAGLNRITREILANAGRATAGMARGSSNAPHADGAPEADSRPAIGLTMFGVTTEGVTRTRDLLADTFDGVVFHATGTGGRAMEKLVDSGLLSGVVDMTTTEIADHIVGGVLSAGPGRLDAIARTGVPWVGSVGALDMVNFWAMDTMPEAFQGRKLHVHNPNITLMRTTVEENRAAGTWLADKLNACDGPVRLLLPEGGVSALDAPGQPFHDPAANAALFSAIEARLRPTAKRRAIRVAAHINDEEFSRAMADTFREIAS